MKISRCKFSEVVDLLDDECSLAEVLQGLELDHGADSDDGDRKRLILSDSGTPELVPSTLLRTDPLQEEEPAFQDSILLLHDYLVIPYESQQAAMETLSFSIIKVQHIL